MSGEELRALAQAATPGPWMQDSDNPAVILKPDKPGFDWDGFIIATLQEDDFGLIEEANSAFIAAANPTAVLALLDERDAYREQWHDLCDQLRDANDAHDAMGAERDALRGQVERVRVLADTAAGQIGRLGQDDILAALDGPQ